MNWNVYRWVVIDRKCRPASGSSLHQDITEAGNKRLRQITNPHFNFDNQIFTLLVNFTGPCFLQMEQIETAGCENCLQGPTSHKHAEGAQEQGLITTSLQISVQTHLLLASEKEFSLLQWAEAGFSSCRKQAAEIHPIAQGISLPRQCHFSFYRHLVFTSHLQGALCLLAAAQV